MQRPRDRVVGFAVAALVLGPLLLIDNNRGHFEPSAEWQGVSLVYYGVITLGLMGAILGAQIFIVERRQPTDENGKMGRMLLRVGVGFVLCCIPLWTLGVVHGVIRRVVDGPILQRLAIDARVERYYPRSGKRGAYVVVETSEFGRVSVSVGAAGPALTTVGAQVRLLGYETWQGRRYDDIGLPAK